MWTRDLKINAFGSVHYLVFVYMGRSYKNDKIVFLEMVIIEVCLQVNYNYEESFYWNTVL